jgi:hypothetical protein
MRSEHGSCFHLPRKAKSFFNRNQKTCQYTFPTSGIARLTLGSEVDAFPLPPAGIPIATLLGVVGWSNLSTALMPEVCPRNILSIQVCSSVAHTTDPRLDRILRHRMRH